MDQLRFAKTDRVLPVAPCLTNFVASRAQGEHIEIAGARHFGFSFVEDVKVVAVTRRILSCIQDQTARKVTLLAPIGSQDTQDLLLEDGQRHALSSWARCHALWSPLRRFSTISRTSASVRGTNSGFHHQKQLWKSLTARRAISTTSGGMVRRSVTVAVDSAFTRQR